MLNQFNVSLWGDEAWAATLAIKPLAQIIKIVAKDTSPPLYYLLDHLWMKIFGTSEVSIRTLTFLFFLGTVFFTYLLGKYLWDQRTGLWAAGLVFTNPFLFRYAFEGRMYALLALTVTASMYFFLRKKSWAYILTTTAALYTHHFAIFAIFVQFLWQIGNSWGLPFKKFLFTFRDFLLIGLLYLPWLSPLYYQTSLVGSGFWLGKPDINSAGKVLKSFLVGPEKYYFQTITLISMIFLILVKKWLSNPSKNFFLLLWFLSPIIFTFGISLVFQSIFFDRYLLYVIPSASLLLASNRRKAGRLFFVLIIITLTQTNWKFFTHPTKRPFRDFAHLVKNSLDQNTLLINYPGGAHHLFESKYYGLQAPLFVPEDNLPFYVGTALMAKEDILKKIPTTVSKLNLITSNSNIQDLKIANFQILKTFQVDELKLVHLVRNR
ncbi:glycosyltransferase family 39 protein [Patescibacteria group bacterium]